MDAEICTSSCYSVAPAGCCPTYFFTYRHAGSILTDRHVNCVRSQCKFLSLAIKRVQEPMKGQGGLVSISTLAALVQDSPPLTLHWLLYAFNLLAQSGALSAAPPARPARPPLPPSPTPPPHPTSPYLTPNPSPSQIDQPPTRPDTV